MDSTTLIPNFEPIFQIQVTADVGTYSQPFINLSLGTNVGDSKTQRITGAITVLTRNVTGLLSEDVKHANFKLSLRATALGGSPDRGVRLYYAALKAYYHISPTIESIEPSSGSGLNPQTSVNINGTDFFDAPGYEPRLRVDGNIEYCDYTSITEVCISCFTSNE